MTDRAAHYSRIKYTLSFIETALLLVLLFLACRTGWSARFSGVIERAYGSPFVTLPVYLGGAFVLWYLVSFPLNFYQSFLLEHRFGLSKQGPGGWFRDQLISLGLVYAFSLFLLAAFFWAMARFPASWWLAISFIWVTVNVAIARLAPVVIVPLFFTYTKLADEGLRGRIISLAAKMRLPVLDVFEIDMSRKTVKANAGLLGWGAGRRVVVGDTLISRYSADEIEVILAHEFAHQKLRHLPKLLAVNALAAFACFFLMYATAPFFLAALGVGRLDGTAAIPLIFAYFVFFGLATQPAVNLVSRRMERNADLMALRATGAAGAFISSMEKLGSQNLADRVPHPLIKCFFFDHPPLGERIAYARRFHP